MGIVNFNHNGKVITAIKIIKNIPVKMVWAMLELQRDRSIELSAAFQMLKCIGWLLLSKTRSGSSKSFYIFLPLMSVCLDPQREL